MYPDRWPGVTKIDFCEIRSNHSDTVPIYEAYAGWKEGRIIVFWTLVVRRVKLALNLKQRYTRSILLPSHASLLIQVDRILAPDVKSYTTAFYGIRTQPLILLVEIHTDQHTSNTTAIGRSRLERTGGQLRLKGSSDPSARSRRG